MTEALGDDEWIAEHGRFLRRVARALLTDETLVDDAVQDAWVEALAVAPPRNPGGWLVHVTRRMAARARRTAADRRGREQVVARPESLPATDAVVAQAEIVRRVAALVSELPDPFRQTLLLRFWEGLPPRVVAARLRVPVATVRSRTRRALERLRADLNASRGSEPTDWRESLAVLAGPAALGLHPRSAPVVHVLGATAMKSKHLVLLLMVLLVATIGVLIVEVDRSGSAGEPSDGPVVERPVQLARAPAPVIATGPTAARSPLNPEPGAVAATARPFFLVRVVDLDDAPVPRAHVFAGDDPDSMHLVGATDEEGRLAVDRTAGPRWVAASEGSWARSPFFPAPPAEGSTITLQLALRGVPLEVRVTREDGDPVEGARVRAGREEEVDYRLPGGATGRTAPWTLERTDDRGIARFTGLRPGWLRVRVDAEGSAPTTAFATLELGTEPSIDVTLRGGFTVAGRIVDERGRPVGGAVVRRGSGEPSTVTDEGGRYRLGPVDPGKVTVLGPRGRRAEARLRGEEGDVVDWSPRLDEAPMLTGRAVDGRGRPLIGWSVRANDDTWPGWRADARTGDEGAFEIFGDREAELRVEVRPSTDVDLPHGVLEGVDPGTRDIVLVADSPGSARVRAHITRDDGGLAGDLPLRLRIATRPDRSRLTASSGVVVAPDEEGRFAVEGLPHGRYEVVLEGAPFGWHRLAEFDLDVSEDLDLGVLVAPVPGVLESRSLWGAPEPMGDARYLLERRDANVTILELRGWFPETLRLAPGTYTLQTEVTPGPQRTVEFEILPGGKTSIDIDLRETCEHVIAVRYADGGAPSGAVHLAVRRLDDDAEMARNVVNEVHEGEWRSTLELPSGRFEFVATDGEGRTARHVEPLYTSTPGRRVVLEIEPDQRAGLAR
ncbi:MAG: sigma-70 family RNA polymerase sigma factor [Planctomycetota bacterium]